MIHVILGTRAQLIKMAPILKALQDRQIPYQYITTGQHQQTIQEIHENFKIKEPHVRLYEGEDIVSIPGMISWMTGVLGKGFLHRKKIFGKKKAGIVLVHGDTVSTVIGALLGKAAGLRVGHVEAGLRSFRLLHPFPEELSRLLTTGLADCMFCPGSWAVENLRKASGTKIDIGANTLYDALQYALSVLPEIRGAEVPPGAFSIVSLHRFENFNSEAKARRVVELLGRIAEKLRLLFILHPFTRRKLLAYSLLQRLEENPRIELRPRYDYFRFIKLLQECEFLMSDGGGNQEECAYLGKPVLLFRAVTERKEGLSHNVVLSGFKEERIFDFIEKYPEYAAPPLKLDFSPTDRIITACHELAAGRPASS